MSKQLKLLARSTEDVSIFSTMLQDATVKVGDIAWMPRQHRFATVVNRFRWERAGPRRRIGRRKAERVRSGLHFNGVLKAQLRNVPSADPDHVMELLAIQCEEAADGTAILTLVFSGYAAIRLEAECIDGVLEDLSAPWKARRVPAHPVAES